MNSLSPSTRLALGLAALTVTVLCIAQLLGILVDPQQLALKERTRLSETVAIAVSKSLADEDRSVTTDFLQSIVTRHDELIGAAVVRSNGEIVVEAGTHGEFWSKDANANSASHSLAVARKQRETQLTVPIYTNNEVWGTVRFRYLPTTRAIFGLHIPPLLQTIAFITAGGFLVHVFILRRMLRNIDPSRAVPLRVRHTLDTLAEGLVVLDRDGRIVLANKAFSDLLRTDGDTFRGKLLADLSWQASGKKITPAALPWSRSLEENRPIIGSTLQLLLPSSSSDKDHDAFLTLLVNSTPIESESNSGHGVIVSFDDISPLEKTKKELAATLVEVQTQSADISTKNKELERLAKHDPLTGCINRRYLFELFENEWQLTQRHGHSLSCIMVDVDHFKSVNDTHGHIVGDRVLARIAAALREAARETDIVARYGGEEFCVLLPHTDIDEAEVAAERLREDVAAIEFPQLSVTASLGVSENRFGAASPQGLIDEADRALFAAKHNGRNCIVRHDAVPEDFVVDGSRPRTTEGIGSSETPNIPFHAVTALISALAYRDQETASHCRRVADLAVATAEGILGVTECYTLEIAALMHDLGKIGVPDNILLKPGKLTSEEWAIMRRHDRIGVEIIRNSFAFDPLSRIVGQYRTPFSSEGPTLTVGARILAIADAYDAMVSDRPYRKGCPPEEAFGELRRCAGGQFDPELVERFISSVQQSSALSRPSISVEKETALSIGVQIESLVIALDDQDLDRLGALAGRLQQVAERYHVDAIADRADGLARAVSEENDLISVLESANDLLRLCRSTQNGYIADKIIED